MSDPVAVGGARDVRGSLDAPDRGTDACVVACPPHPEMGGNRHDGRVTAVADALVDRGVACLRFDYGERDGGHGERTDADRACDWAAERHARVGLFGYSFGALIGLKVAAERSDLGAVSVLAPPESSGGIDASGTVPAVDAPLQVVYGERDDTVSWRPIVAAAREASATVEALAADHHFVGQSEAVGGVVASFLADALVSQR